MVQEPNDDAAPSERASGAPSDAKPESKPVRRIVRSRSTRETESSAALGAPDTTGEQPSNESGTAASSAPEVNGAAPPSSEATSSNGEAKTRLAPSGKRVFDLRVKRPPPPPKEEEPRRRDRPPRAERQGPRRPERTRPEADKAAPRDGTEPASATEYKPAPKPEAKVESKPADKPSAKPAAKTEDKPSPKPADKPSAKPAARTEDKPSPKPETKAESKPAQATPAADRQTKPEALDEVRRFASVPAPRVLAPPEKKAPTAKDVLRDKVAARAQAHAKSRGGSDLKRGVAGAPTEEHRDDEEAAAESPAKMKSAAEGEKAGEPRRARAKAAPPRTKAKEVPETEAEDVAPAESPGFFSRILSFFRGSSK